MKRWAILLALMLGLTTVTALATWVARQPSQCRDLGPVDRFDLISVNAVDCFPAFVVRRPDGIRVFLSESPHLLGEHLVWDDDRQVFWSRAHGETFDAAGNLLVGPAHGGMYECPTTIAGNRLYVGEESDRTVDDLAERCRRGA